MKDPELVGAWWRCADHGLTVDPILLGGHAYCPDERCELEVPLVSSVMRHRRTRQELNDWAHTKQDSGPRPRGRISIKRAVAKVLAGAKGPMSTADLFKPVSALTGEEPRRGSLDQALYELKQSRCVRSAGTARWEKCQ